MDPRDSQSNASPNWNSARRKSSTEIARLRNVESAKARKRDTRRKILAGSWVLAEAERDQALDQRLRKGLDAFLERDGDREVWGPDASPQAI